MNKNNRLSYSRRDWLIQIGFVSLLCLVAVLTTYVTFRELDSAAYRRRQAIAYLASTSVGAYLDRSVDLGISLATRVRFRELIAQGRWDEAIRLLSSIPRDFPFVDRVFVTDLTGTLRADTPELPGVRGTSFAFRDWYKGVSQSWQPYISEVYIRSAQPQIQVVAVAVPIRSEGGDLLGILVLQLKLDSFRELLGKIELGAEGVVYIVDQRGQLIAHSQISDIGNVVDYSNRNAVAALLAGRSGVELLTDQISGERMLTAFESAIRGWGVVVEQPEASAFATRNAITGFLIALWAIFILIMWVFLRVVLRRGAKLRLQRDSEHRTLASIGDGVFVIDLDYKITFWNRAAQRITGLLENEVVGKRMDEVFRFINESDREENRRFIDEVLVTGEIRRVERDTLLRTHAGREVKVGDSAAPVFDEQGRVSGAIVVFRDLSAESLATSLRSDFGSASAAVTPPIAAAVNSMTLLKDKLEGENKEIALRAIRSLLSTKKLISELLAVSQLEAGVVTPRLELADLTNLVRLAIAEVRRDGAVSVSLETVPPSGLVMTDEAFLKAIFLEILDNAVLYNKPGGSVTIKIAAADDHYSVEVNDTGIGIPEADRLKVGTKFFRGSNIDASELPGVGLGVYIAKKYANLIGVKIGFASKVGVGTKFSISVPLVK